MSMQDMAIKSLLAMFGYTPEQIRVQFEERAHKTFATVAAFDERLTRIEQSLARIEQHLGTVGTGRLVETGTSIDGGGSPVGFLLPSLTNGGSTIADA